MNKITQLKCFIEVAKTSSFTKAATRLNMTRARVSAYVKALETELRTSFFQRTTRHVSLTMAGEAYFELVDPLVEKLMQADEAIHLQTLHPVGQLRIEISEGIANALIVPKLPAFIEKYPELSLNLIMTERPLIIADEGIDIAIRLTELDDSSYRYKLLCYPQNRVVASSSYLNKYGIPTHPLDLKQHRLIDFFNSSIGKAFDWTFKKTLATGEDPIIIAAQNYLVIDSVQAGIQLTKASIGIYGDFSFILDAYIESNELIEVLPDWERIGPPIIALYANTKPIPLKIKLFLDFLDDIFSDLALPKMR